MGIYKRKEHLEKVPSVHEAMKSILVNDHVTKVVTVKLGQLRNAMRAPLSS